MWPAKNSDLFPYKTKHFSYSRKYKFEFQVAPKAVEPKWLPTAPETESRLFQGVVE